MYYLFPNSRHRFGDLMGAQHDPNTLSVSHSKFYKHVSNINLWFFVFSSWLTRLSIINLNIRKVINYFFSELGARKLSPLSIVSIYKQFIWSIYLTCLFTDNIVAVIRKYDRGMWTQFDKSSTIISTLLLIGKILDIYGRSCDLSFNFNSFYHLCVVLLFIIAHLSCTH